MLFCCGKGAQSSGEGGVPSCLGIELFAKPADVLGLVVYNWQHPAQEKKAARLSRFDIRAEWSRGGWELYAKVFEPAFCAAQLQTLAVHHRPTCAPSSTCSTSPVT